MHRYTDQLRLLDALGLAVLATGRDGAVTFANDRAETLFGRTGLEGGSVADLLGALPLEEVLGGTTWRGDVRIGDGDLVAAVAAAPVRDPADGVVGAIISLEDITQTRRAQAEAAANDQRLRLAHAAAELGTWHWNALDGTNVWDPQLHHIYGLEPDSFDGTYEAWVASIHPDDRDEAIAVVQRAIEQSSSYVLRNRIVRPDGRPAWIEAHGKVLTDESGTFAGTIGCVQDVTERIDLERRVAAISEELQRSLAASPLPVLDGVEVAASYAPGGDDLEQIGGDWYDAVPTVAGGLLLVVGDVMGRGVRAATTMIHVRAGIRGLLTLETAPAALLEAADELVARDAADQFITATAVLVDPAAGTVELSNAGHIPVVVVHPGGGTVVAGLGSGPPLGVVADQSRTSERLRVESGSTVLLVTDGVVESRDHDLDAGIARLRHRAAELWDRPLAELVDQLADLADTRLRDDVTVVAARVR
ncbi:PP2C family protein-serine/threonine phosphatase [Nocardioides mangrovi]|uniref:SpoIIE family protein phosphatase n=1 Tax=Nocardioides mangrovi TaxID=2874580 RepID=A0ABS7UBI8_9ACTN|nr:SpoIIE family protein phosphatase [Nocardioides mangrovi]MBZ5738096.1 SpoIIE family protein phosphatase [Nocardioides mangrovi]